MTTSTVLEHLSTLLLVLGVGYLSFRAVRQLVVQKRSYDELPFRETGRPNSDDPFTDRARAALLGLAIGDAVGMPRESLPVWLANLRFGHAPALSRGFFRFMRRKGTVSDDTQLTVATARAIDDRGEFRPDEFQRLLVDWLDHAIGPGRATKKAARGWKSDHDRRDPDSQGNGAAMRVVPLAIVYHDEPDTLVDMVRENARQTHPNPEAVAGAEAVARLVAYFLELEADATFDAETLIDAALPRSTTQDLDAWRERIAKVAEQVERGERLEQVGTSGWVEDTISAVIYLLLTYGVQIDEALREILAAGGDVDTIAALYAACVGAWRGTGVLKPKWVEEVQGAATLIEQADRLVEAARARHQ